MIKKLFELKMLLLLTLFFLFMLMNNSLASALTDDDLYCKNDILMDLDSGNILYGKNIDERIYPASTTKILTAILTIENLDLKDKIIVSQEAYNLIPYESSVMGVKPGEIYTAEDLLYGLMLPSGNDAAIVLAEKISGNVDNFVILMNEKLKGLGLNNTHFKNPHGYHDNNHYSTAIDMANLFRYCMQNETFKKIISTLEYEIPPTNLTKESRILRNTNRISDPTYTNIYYEYILGGKTGYTIEANGTFVGYGSKDGKNIIICTFNGAQNINGNQARFIDTKTLAEYAFANFEEKEILKASNFKLKLYDSAFSRNYIIGLNDNLYGLYNIRETFIIDYNLNINFNTLSILSYSEETSINNSKVGKLNIYDKNKNLINSIDLVYLGSELNLIKNKKIILYFIPSISIILLIFLILVSSKKSN